MHSWAGIGLGLEDAKKLGGKFLGQPKFERVKQRWQSVQTLIIDEGLRHTVFYYCLMRRLNVLLHSIHDRRKAL